MFLYISVRKVLFERRSKILFGGGWFGGRLNNFLKVAGWLGLINSLTIFLFYLNFWKFNYFTASIYLITTQKLSRQFGLQG